ncbi:MAG: carbohydrate kinase [Anaerolineaceae bacterium]|nr:carbohydrate kinase [Anaerolineaceae bacterium]
MKTEKFLLGIDIGTSVIKCVVFNETCEEIAVVNCIPEILHKQENFSEISMDSFWLQVYALIKKAIVEIGRKSENISGIGISGTACGCWLIDEKGSPVRDAILWNDGRAADIIGHWQSEDVMDEIFRYSGNSIFPGYPVALMKWLSEYEPDSLKKARWSVFCKDWIRYKLTGRVVVDHSDMGYFPYNIKKRTISDHIFKICGIEDCRRLVPEIVEPDSEVGLLLPEIAEGLGLPKPIPVVAGLVDVAAATLGGGAYKSGHVCSIIGTSFLNNILSVNPSFSPFGIGVQTSTVKSFFVRSMVNTSGTINLQWFLDNFCAHEILEANQKNGSIYDWAERLVMSVPIGSEGIIYHPYINTTGVVSPFVNPTARAQFFGISSQNTRAHLLRSIYEGTALSMLDSFMHMPAEINEVYLSGGGSRSAFWCQMFADCTGKKMILTKGHELGARGVAILAGIACGLYPDLDTAMDVVIEIDQTFTPNPGNTEKYKEIYSLYKSLYEHVAPDWWDRHNLIKHLKAGK